MDSLQISSGEAYSLASERTCFQSSPNVTRFWQECNLWPFPWEVLILDIKVLYGISKYFFLAISRDTLFHTLPSLNMIYLNENVVPFVPSIGKHWGPYVTNVLQTARISNVENVLRVKKLRDAAILRTRKKSTEIPVGKRNVSNNPSPIISSNQFLTS